MTSTELATTQGNALAMHGEAAFWTPNQIAALRHLGVDKASNADLAVFHHVCQRTGLDPFARQIYMIERTGKQTIQTGIDGFRLVARRAVNGTKETLSIGSADWCGADGVWRDAWVDESQPAAARVTVTRGTGTYVAVALMREYLQFDRHGKVTSMWSTRGAGQLAKCAEALALRKAFPQDLSGVYSTDEMDHANSVKSNAPSALDQALADDTETVDGEVVDDGPPETGEEQTQASRGRMFALFAEQGIEDRDKQISGINQIIKREIASRSQLTETETRQVISSLEERMAEPFAKEES